jgi:hypothetical protein
MYSIEIICGLIVGAFALLALVSVGSTTKITIGILLALFAVAAYVVARALWQKSRRRFQ